MKKDNKLGQLIILISICFFLPTPIWAADEKIEMSKGQLIYVPAYSHIYSGDREKPFFLTVTLSIRNIDPDHPIQVKLVDYYESQGKLLTRYIDKPITIDPLGTVRYVIPDKDKSGGSGANFMVMWQADVFVNPPIVESIMISTKSQQGISFTSRGREIMLRTE